MLKFVDGEKPHKLINYVFSIKIVKNKSGDKNDYIANPTQIFPQNLCEQSILKSVQLFAFPDRAAIESRCFFTFVIGDPSSSDFQLGFVLYYTYFDAYCVLSNYYYPDMFNHLLTLEKNEMLSVCSELAKEKTYDHSNKTACFVIKGKNYPLDGGNERQQLTKLLFTTFPAFDISKIIIGMLSARHVFVVAGNASTCSLFAAALPLLIEPFFWDLNLIPILPLKIIEMIDVPVPAMIGITRSELLQTQTIAPHICVNCDTKHVLDSPVFEQSNIGLRLEVVKKQLDFHTQVNLLLNEWSKCPGFPHKLVLEKVMRFISYYLQLYTGDCMSSVNFLAAIKTKLPDYLLNSQIINQLLILDDLDNKYKVMFKKWFNTSFIKDAAEDLKKSNEIVSMKYEINSLFTDASNSQMPQQRQSQAQQQNQASQLRSTQPLSSAPQPLQQQSQMPQRSTSGNLQSLPPGNQNHYSSNPVMNSQPINRNIAISLKPPNQPSYPQNSSNFSASSYNQSGPQSSRVTYQSARPGFPQPSSYRSFNDSTGSTESPNNSDSSRFSSNDASPNNSYPNNDRNPLAQLSNVNNPNGDLLFSFNSGENTPMINPFSNNNSQPQPTNTNPSSAKPQPTNTNPPSAKPQPAPAKQAQNPVQNPASFEIFAKYNQQKTQQQAQQNQIRQTLPPQQFPQNQLRPNSTFQQNQQYSSQTQQYQSNPSYPQSNPYPNRISQNQPVLQNPFQSSQPSQNQQFMQQNQPNNYNQQRFQQNQQNQAYQQNQAQQNLPMWATGSQNNYNNQNQKKPNDSGFY